MDADGVMVDSARNIPLEYRQNAIHNIYGDVIGREDFGSALTASVSIATLVVLANLF